MHQKLDYNQSISTIKDFERTEKQSSVIVIGGGSGYGHAIKSHFTQRGWYVETAGISEYNDNQINLESEEEVRSLAKAVRTKNFEYVVITAATDFLDSEHEKNGYTSDYMNKMHLNAFYLWTLCKELNSLEYRPTAIIALTSEAGWSQGPKTHLHYNVSKSILNTIIINMYECYELTCIGVDPGEARTRMNQHSNRCTSSIIPIMECLFERSKKRSKELAGKFFHADGRCLSFNKSDPLT